MLFTVPQAGRRLGVCLFRRIVLSWAAGLAPLLSLPVSASAQLSVVNGDFSDLTGLTQGNDGWHAGLPRGWSGASNTYAVDVKRGTTPPTCNPSVLGFFRQEVGRLAAPSDVALTFDVCDPWSAGAIVNAAILDGDLAILAEGDFPAGTQQTLVAKQVPAGTSIIVAFGAAKLTPGLDNVTIAGSRCRPQRKRPSSRPRHPVHRSPWPVTTSGTIIRAIRETQNRRGRIGPSGNWLRLLGRFPGHHQPNVPLWGYTDEANPQVMAQKIAAAADHGIDAFIFDWYYYDDGPFLDRPIDSGFLQASNNSRMKFAFMWANHDWLEIHPYKRGTEQRVLYPGVVTPATFEKICDHVIASYFQHPSYWRIDGRPYFSFYDLTTLLTSFGSVDATRAALDDFRAKAVAAGLPGLHLNAVVWGQPILPGERKPANAPQLVKDLGFDSVTSYVWIHHVPLPQLQTDYNEVRDTYLRYWSDAERRIRRAVLSQCHHGMGFKPASASSGRIWQFWLSLYQHHQRQHTRAIPGSVGKDQAAFAVQSRWPADLEHQLLERMDGRELPGTRSGARAEIPRGGARRFSATGSRLAWAAPVGTRSHPTHAETVRSAAPPDVVCGAASGADFRAALGLPVGDGAWSSAAGGPGHAKKRARVVIDSGS